MADTIPCTAAEAAILRDLTLAFQRAERDVSIAFSMFVRAHDLPDACTLLSVEAGSVTVQRPPGAGMPHG